MRLQTIRSWLLGLGGICLLAACGGDNSQQEESTAAVPVTPLTYQLSLTPTTGQVAVGKTLPLIATVTDSLGHTVSNPPVTFASSDPAVASVANDGLVTGVKAGVVTVTAKVTAPDGNAISQQASLTVVAPAITYNLALTNPALNLQYNQPTTTSAKLMGSDGTDVTAQATGWTWTSNQSATVSAVSVGASATLTAHNTSATTSAAATISVQATAPDGSVVSGQIAATALPDYTYQINLSAATAKIAEDRTATITARVIRSDGADVTSQFTNWKWSWPPNPAPGAVFIQLATTAGGAVATFSSVLIGGSGTVGAFSTNTVTVTADGPGGATPAPPATLQLAQYKPYIAVMDTYLGSVGSPIPVAAKVIHNSDDAAPDVTGQCGSLGWYGSPGLTVVPTGGPVGQAIATAAAPGGYLAYYTCMIPAYGPISGIITVYAN